MRKIAAASFGVSLLFLGQAAADSVPDFRNNAAEAKRNAFEKVPPGMWLARKFEPQVKLLDSSRYCLVQDVIFDKEHSVQAYVLHCRGSKSMFEPNKRITLHPQAFSWVTFDGQDVLQVAITDAEFVKAPSFRY